MGLRPLFSIIIPAKDEERDLPRSLRALAELSFHKEQFEVIVVDNGSTDATVSIVDNFGFAVHVQPQLSLSGVRNFGAGIARGEILVFLDADCVPDRGWLQNAAVAFRDVGTGCTGSTPLAPDDGTWVERVWSSFRTRRRQKCDTSWINSSNLFVRRELFDAIGGFNEKVQTCEDVDICMRLNSICRIVFDPSIKVVHLGEPKTVREFFLKEIWRGKGTVSGIISHGITRSELKSLLLPVYYLAVSFAMPMAISLFARPLVCMVAFLYLLPALVFSTWIIAKTRNYSYGAGYFFLFLLYANARSIALFRR